METTFMSIHNLSPEANILFASESISEILGYEPHEVVGKSCFDYFHPDETPFARTKYDNGVKLDKAAVLNYVRVKNKAGEWIGCECVFTVVHDVLVACTSIYQHNEKSEKRHVEAEKLRRLFSATPKDPRYHMLEHLSSKFKASPEPSIREPRAALILNRFTRTLTVMYSTNAIASILGIPANQIIGKSFYECIRESCLQDAIKCLESAKANDSIAYLRFWYRDPRRQDELDELERDASNSSDSEDGGVPLNPGMEIDANAPEPHTSGDEVMASGTPSETAATSDQSSGSRPTDSRKSSGMTSDLENEDGDADAYTDAVFDSDRRGVSQTSRLSAGVVSSSSGDPSGPSSTRISAEPHQDLELEAVVSCTSDGLVVVLRRARPIAPAMLEPAVAYPNGLFAAPWGVVPPQSRHQAEPGLAFPADHLHQLQDARDHLKATNGPSIDDFMKSIQDVAVFAWSLTGINGKIAAFGKGTPYGQSVPPTGFPVYDPDSLESNNHAPENQALQKWQELHRRTNEPYGNPKVPYQHARQERLLRRQMGYGAGPMGTDASGSPARRHLGRLMGEDWRGPGYYPYARPQRRDRNRGPAESDEHFEVNPLNDGTHAEPGAPHQAPDANSTGDRYLWY